MLKENQVLAINNTIITTDFCDKLKLRLFGKANITNIISCSLTLPKVLHEILNLVKEVAYPLAEEEKQLLLI